MRFYHNPRCSKSREALALCRERDAEIEVIEYLKTPPDLKTLKEICKALGGDVESMSRKADLKKVGLSPSLELLANEPKYLERPILVSGNKAVVGRPPEKVLELL